MNKVLRVVVASAFVFAAIAPASAAAPPPVHPLVVVGNSSAGAWAAGGFIGFVAFLATYDFVRRTTCLGDPLVLGGPGFTEPLPNGNVMIPQCPTGKYKGR